MEPEFVLETRGLTKEFRGFTAVDSVDLKVRQGHIHALIGPNGAGKTTVFNLLTKFLTPTRGEILYRGKNITSMKASEIARLGLVRSFQISAVFGHMSVLENVRVALQQKMGTSFHFWKSERSLRELDDQVMQLLAEVDLQAFAQTLAVELPYGRKRALGWPPPWRWTPSCCCSTNRPRAWAVRMSTWSSSWCARPPPIARC